MDIEKISLIAQAISFEFEDTFHIKKKKDLFIIIFNKYLNTVDPGVTTDPYDAIIALGKTDPAGFDNMLKELKEKDLVSL